VLTEVRLASRLAIVLVFGGALLFAIPSCHSGGAANVAGGSPSSNARSVLSARANALPSGYTASAHFLQRMRERGVSEEMVSDVLRSGQQYYDPKNDSTIRWKDGVYVAIAPGGVLKTVIQGPIERRWVPR
jgi:hypothetical protein